MDSDPFRLEKNQHFLLLLQAKEQGTYRYAVITQRGNMAKKSKNPVTAMASGCIAGAVEATFVWPMEFIKVGRMSTLTDRICDRGVKPCYRFLIGLFYRLNFSCSRRQKEFSFPTRGWYLGCPTPFEQLVLCRCTADLPRP